MTYELTYDGQNVTTYHLNNAKAAEDKRYNKSVSAQNSSKRKSKAAQSKKTTLQTRNKSVTRTPTLTTHKLTAQQAKSRLKKQAKVIDIPIVRTVKSVKIIPFPTTIVCLALICTILFMATVLSFVKINETTIELEDLEYELTALINKQKDLTLDLEEKNDLRAIEEYATQKLGMVKIDQLAKKYISVEIEDKIERIKTIQDDSGSIWDRILNSAEKSLKNLMEYFK